MLFKKMSLMLVRDKIRSLRFAVDKLYHQLLLLHTQLANTVDKNTWDYWDHCSSRRVDLISKKLRIKHDLKLSKLEQQESSSNDNSYNLQELEQQDSSGNDHSLQESVPH